MMGTNSVERIALRFSYEETAALLKLLGHEELPGTRIRAATPGRATVDSLTDAGIVLPCGEHILVDRAAALIFNTAAGSRRFVRAEGSDGAALLFQVGDLVLQLLIQRIQPLEHALRLGNVPFGALVGSRGRRRRACAFCCLPALAPAVRSRLARARLFGLRGVRRARLLHAAGRRVHVVQHAADVLQREPQRREPLDAQHAHQVLDAVGAVAVFVAWGIGQQAYGTVMAQRAHGHAAVSYTHLTLPTT